MFESITKKKQIQALKQTISEQKRELDYYHDKEYVDKKHQEALNKRPIITQCIDIVDGFLNDYGTIALFIEDNKDIFHKQTIDVLNALEHQVIGLKSRLCEAKKNPDSFKRVIDLYGDDNFKGFAEEIEQAVIELTEGEKDGSQEANN